MPPSTAQSDAALQAVKVRSNGVSAQAAGSKSSGGMSTCSLAMVGILSTTCGYLGGTLAVPAHQEKLSDLSTAIMTNGSIVVSGLHEWATTATDANSCPAGVIIPGISATPLNAAVYLLLLFWSFLGVAIGSDVFMMAIEFITSAEKITKVRVDGGLRSFSVLIWNPTIANLTLMALGSSAPEILLSIIEIATGGFYAGELGPSTIVGSAAFNLMVISGVCVMTIPDGEVRKIKELSVFFITATFSIIAYLWLLVILVANTPDMVDIWEATVTFLLFPLLVWLAYLADVKAGCFRQREAHGDGGKLVGVTHEGKPVTAEDVSRAYNLIKDSAENVTEAVRELLSGPHSRAFYRLTATIAEDDENLVGATKAAALGGGARKSTVSALRDRRSTINPSSIGKDESSSKISTISFDVSTVSVPLADGWCELLVKRTGALDGDCEVSYLTEDMGASQKKAPTVESTLRFPPYQDKRFVRFKLVPGTSTYGVFLRNPSLTAQLGALPTCWVAVTQTLESGAGMISFEHESYECRESDGEVRIAVLRTGGNSQPVSCSLRTIDDSAVAPYDYVALRQAVVFAEGEMRKEIAIKIIDDGKYEADEEFKVMLSEPTNGAVLINANDESCFTVTTRVKVISDEETHAKVDQILADIDFDVDEPRLGGANWGSQFVEAFEFPDFAPGVGLLFSVFVYLVALPFKLVFAMPPPPRIGGGWACFCSSLALIGLLTALIGDLANHVGCCFGLSLSTTAITLVALGTSLPDTFASMTAAKQEPYADASIGNITGSNSVNVFLGLGLPWLSAALYWRYIGDATAWHARYANEPWYTPGMPVGFAVPAGTLSFSVAVFSACALLTLGTLMLRRSLLGYELGGKADGKFITSGFFCLLWVAYIAANVMPSQAR